MNSTIKPIYEFVLWENCNNDCDFCFLKAMANYKDKLYNDDEKLNSLEDTITYIQNNTFVPQSHILIAGGELFFKPFSPDLYNKFQELITLVIDLIKSGQFDLFYINSNLLYTDFSQVYSLIIQPFIDAGLVSHLHFTTSYDPYGRYKTEDARQLFLTNLQNISKDFKDIPGFTVYVNCILTQPFCEDIINGRFNQRGFQELCYNKLYVNYLPYIPFSKPLEPSDSLIYKTLLYLADVDKPYFIQYINTILLNQERIVLDYNKTTREFSNRTAEVNPKCNHLQSFTKYQPNGECLLCKFKKIKDAIL
jgi:hypothetical protein